MKVLVTGSSGHLGEALCLTLQRKGIEYVGIDIQKGKFTIDTGTISDKQFINKVFKNISHVIHTATLISLTLSPIPNKTSSIQM